MGAYVEPVIENGGYRFTVKVGTLPVRGEELGTKMSRRVGMPFNAWSQASQ